MFVVVKKKHVILTLLLIPILIGVAVGLVAGSRSASAQPKSVPVYAVDRDDNKVALSFDAAWGSDKTAAILDLLDRYNVKATFFLVGFWIDANPELTQEIASRGHCIGNHSENHPHMSQLDSATMSEEIDSVNAKLLRLTGQSPVFFRPPFGDYNNVLLETVKNKNMVGVQWSVDSLDWKGIDGSEITERILSKAQSGSIILCHNNSDHILDALPTVLLGLKNKGLSCVRMDELVRTDGYEIDNNGIQRAKLS